MRAWLLRVVLCFSVAGWTVPVQAADPVVMFLLGLARDALISAARRPATPEPLPPAAQTYPGTAVEPRQLRRLIDESFTYLSSEQRRELFASLNNVLLEPRNAAMRAPMIEHFAQHANAVRTAQQRLAGLSERDMRALAREFRKEIAELPEEERGQLLAILEQRLLPVPSSLNQLLLAELNAQVPTRQ
jgi:hypothetical protein